MKSADNFLSTNLLLVLCLLIVSSLPLLTNLALISLLKCSTSTTELTNSLLLLSITSPFPPSNYNTTLFEYCILGIALYR